MPFVVGETIGQYRILEKRGRGGMATVFKAYHPALDRYVAIKALHPAFMEDPNFLARFQREARVVAKLEHPNIVPIYDFAEHEGRPYLVMKFIEGETLKARLQRDPVEQDELLKIVAAVAAGLFYAHQKGILHRDVKPSNVLLGFDGRVYLADFGLARIAQAGESTLSSDMMLGTPQYISPEQAMGVSELDAGTDIYSFGVMLYEMIVGSVPFSADTPFSIIHDHIYTPLPLPRQVNANVPEAVERVLLKALAKERVDRFADANELAEAFEKAIYADELTAVPVDDLPGTPTEIQKPPPASAPDLVQPAASAAESAVQPGPETPILPQQFETQEPVCQVTPVSAPKMKKGPRMKWWQIVLAVAALLLVGAAGLIVLNQLRDYYLGEEIYVFETEDEMAFALEEARAWAAENPNDPIAQLDLALLLMDMDQLAEASEVFGKAFVASGEDQEIVLIGVDLMTEKGMWLGITTALLAYQQQYPDQFNDVLYDRFSEAAYISAEFPVAEKGIPIRQIMAVDSNLERVVKSRYILHNGNRDDAQPVLDEVLLGTAPEFSVAHLLQAEIQIEFGDQPGARQTLTALETLPDLPDWVLAYAGMLWGRLGEDFGVSQDHVENNPNDIWAHLDLLDSSLAVENYEETEAQYGYLMSFDGKDPEIYFAAGEILSKHGAWPYAVGLYNRALNLGYQPNDTVVERVHMAAYFGSLFPDGLRVLANPETGLSGDLFQIAKARHELYEGDYTIAADAIRNLLERDPFFDEERMLEAERLIKVNEIGAAKQILTEIEQEETKPFWLREHAKKLLAKINQ